MSKKGIVWALVAAVIGTLYLLLATMGPLKDTNLGLGLTAGLSSQTIVGGYNMANVVLFVVFAILIVVLAVVWASQQKKEL
jgi:multisubunit Na+/H+ antiporter MnhB subunit